MKYIIFDLEATCWDREKDPLWLRQNELMEIIEIGAVSLATKEGPIGNTFSKFVKPVIERELSDFCKTLTTITQNDVEKADLFPVVLNQFVEWIGSDPVVLCSWGDFDIVQMKKDCTRHEIAFPTVLSQHINIKTEFAKVMQTKPCGMKKALAKAGLPLVGTHHRGIDDAINLASLALLVLPKI